MVSQPAYFSVEIVTDKPTSGKISIPQIPKQKGNPRFGSKPPMSEPLQKKRKTVIDNDENDEDSATSDAAKEKHTDTLKVDKDIKSTSNLGTPVVKNKDTEEADSDKDDDNEDSADNDDQKMVEKDKKSANKSKEEAGNKEHRMLYMVDVPQTARAGHVYKLSPDIKSVRMKKRNKGGKPFIYRVALTFDDVETMEKNFKELNGKPFLDKRLNLRRYNLSHMRPESEIAKKAEAKKSEEYLRLYVTGLEKTMTKEKLKTMFPDSESILLPMNFNNTEIEGIAFVAFDSHLKAKKALEENQDKDPIIVRRDTKPWATRVELEQQEIDPLRLYIYGITSEESAEKLHTMFPKASNIKYVKGKLFGFVYFDNEEDCKKALEESQDNEYFSVAPGRKTRCSDTKGNYKKEVVKKNRDMKNRGLKNWAMKKRAMKKRAKNSVQNVN